MAQEGWYNNHHGQSQTFILTINQHSMKLRKIVVAFLLVWAGSSWAGLPLEAQDQGRKFTVRVENVTMKEAIEAIKEKR